MSFEEQRIRMVAAGAGMIDIPEPSVCEIQIDKSGKRIWVNINGICRLRLTSTTGVAIEDDRELSPIPILAAS